MVGIIGERVRESDDHFVLVIADPDPPDLRDLVVAVPEGAVHAANELNRRLARGIAQRDPRLLNLRSLVEPEQKLFRGDVQDVARVHQVALVGNDGDQLRCRNAKGRCARQQREVLSRHAPGVADMDRVRSGDRHIDDDLLHVINMVRRGADRAGRRIGRVECPRIMGPAGPRHPQVQVVHEHRRGNVQAGTLVGPGQVGPDEGGL